MSVTILLDLRSRLGPVRDQGPRPTCLAFAATTAHEYARASTSALSPEYLYHFASNGGSSGHGTDFSSVSRELVDHGQPVETDCPYLPHDPSPGWAPPSNLPLYRRQSTLPQVGADEIEASLVTGHAPVLGIATTYAFYAPTAPYLISSSGSVMGLHAVVAVGLGMTHATRCFLIRNSWGTTWADSGHAWLDDAFIDKHLRKMLVLTDEVTQ